MYDSSDIVWVKNVLRDHGNGWAYDDKIFDAPFTLNWPVKFRGSIFTSNIGDIMLLFQRPTEIDGIRNSSVFLTHLVSPIDLDEQDDPTRPNFRYGRLVELIAIANPINSIPNPGYFNFFKPNRGQTHSIKNLGDARPEATVESTQKAILALFNGHLNPQFQFAFDLPQIGINDIGELEGDIQIQKHIQLERRIRSSRIVKLAKLIGLQNGNGYIQCECCNFDFRRTYGNLGVEYIECHHKDFLSSGERITTILDLSLVCSNCHRMLHRKNQAGEYYSIEELRSLIETNRTLNHI
jgi:hypothetical protein